MSARKWYALAVTAGRESKIRQRILDRLDRRGITIPGLALFTPEEQVVKNRKGERVVQTRVAMPGYILLNCRRLEDNHINVISRVSGVLEFLGGNDNPSELRSADVDRMLGTGNGSDGGTSNEALFNVGDTVKVVEGAMTGFEGDITEVNEEAGTAIVQIEIFGRATPTKLNFRQITMA